MVDYSRYTEPELLELMHSNDEAAFAELYDRFKIVLYKHAYRLLADHDEVQDVIQEVFTALWQKRTDMNVRISLVAYLSTAVRNQIFNLLSRQQVATRYTDSLHNYWESTSVAADERLRLRELESLISKEIEALPPKMKQAFLLSRDKKRTYQDIGNELGISEKTVRNQVYNATQILKGKLKFILILFLASGDGF